MHPAAAFAGLGRGRLFFPHLSNALLSAGVLAAVAVAFLPSLAFATAPNDPAADPCLQAAPLSVTYTVQSGDSLYGIADSVGIAAGEQNAWIAKVVSLNDLADRDSLRTGQSLTLPPAAAPDPAKGATTYVVKTGDTLSGIADNAGVDPVNAPCWMARAVSLNNLASADAITAGQSIRLPPLPGAAPVPTTNTDTVAAPASAPKNAGLAYTVGPGDTLYGIAMKLGVPEADADSWMAATVRLSQLPDADHLTAGATLTVPPLPAAAAVISTAPVTPPPVGGPPPGQAPLTATSAPTTAALAGSATTVTTAPAASDSSSPIYLHGGSFYTLKPGDTLKGIAQKLGVPPDKHDFWIAQVAAINGISPTALPIGDGIRIP